MNVCSIWPFAQISDDFYYLDIWQCAIYFVAALFKELALLTIIEMWGLESRSRTSRSRSRLLWQSLGLVSKFEPGLGLGGYGLDYINGSQFSVLIVRWRWFQPGQSVQLKYLSVRPLRRKLTHVATDASTRSVQETNNDFCVILHTSGYVVNYWQVVFS